MSHTKFNLQRFLDAQEGVYPVALKEIRNGGKRSHWIWYIFPQQKGLGYSYNSEFYGLDGEEEARAYLASCIGCPPAGNLPCLVRSSWPSYGAGTDGVGGGCIETAYFDEAV